MLISLNILTRFKDELKIKYFRKIDFKINFYFKVSRYSKKYEITRILSYFRTTSLSLYDILTQVNANKNCLVEIDEKNLNKIIDNVLDNIKLNNIRLLN